MANWIAPKICFSSSAAIREVFVLITCLDLNSKWQRAGIRCRNSISSTKSDRMEQCLWRNWFPVLHCSIRCSTRTTRRRRSVISMKQRVLTTPISRVSSPRHRSLGSICFLLHRLRKTRCATVFRLISEMGKTRSLANSGRYLKILRSRHERIVAFNSGKTRFLRVHGFLFNSKIYSQRTGTLGGTNRGTFIRTRTRRCQSLCEKSNDSSKCYSNGKSSGSNRIRVTASD